ncbi:SDR family NAD(P)-dependent oxidoreductase [Larkinella soli]|uniref:SDR family NAD(P)-dependent oxidoreductase n=1 Tax=Larkinella soli TaxID=1770527 RepID=UPI001E2A9825|nr:SDR family oxidoreductase [Larkinella soli]
MNTSGKSSGPGLPTWLWGLAGVGTLMAVNSILRQRRKTDFRGKTVVITGGSRGLGLVMARQFAQEGARIAICARSEPELERAKADLEVFNVEVNTYVCDLRQPVDIRRFIQAVQQDMGDIDVLVNNAGIIMVSPIEHFTETDFREALETNFWAAYHTTEAVLPQMRRNRSGRIINVSSFGGRVPFPHLLPYITGKFAIVGYSEGLRGELLKDGIYVTTACPGLIRTGSPRNAIFKGQNEKEYAWFKIGDSLPGLSLSAEETARQIIDACRYGEAVRITTVPAKVITALHGLFPSLTGEVLAVINNLLPEPGGIGEQRAQGKDSETDLSYSFLAGPTDEAADRNNQLGPK